MANLRESDEMEVFHVVSQAEESVLEAGRKWAKAVGDAIPVELPVLRQVVKGAFDFTEELLKAQLEFAQVMVKATRPVPRPHRTAGTATPHRAPRSARKAA